MKTVKQSTWYPECIWEPFKNDAPPTDHNLDEKTTVAVGEYVLNHCDDRLDDEQAEQIREVIGRE